MKSELIPRLIRCNHRLAQLTKARKDHKCAECGYLIEQYTDYYQVIIGGGGLASIKFPNRVHVNCIEAHMGLKGNKYQGVY